jgi:Zn finger protein HypA/HybF involved in hydrogenase expression
MIWNWLVGLLVWLSSDPVQVDLEPARAAAAASAAMASMSVEQSPPKPPSSVCDQCAGKGVIVMPDGHRVKCPKCGGTGKGCPDGTCPKK